MSKLKNEKTDIMRLIAKTIIKSRYIIMALFVAAAVFCAMSMGKVRINEDITAFLPDTTETRRGISIMDEEFKTYSSAKIMVSNITYESARALADEIDEYDHVADVTFDDSSVHYKNSAAMLEVSFDDNEESPESIAALDKIRERLSEYDIYVSSTVGENYSQKVAEQMGGIIAIAAIVILAVLLFTSRSYFEIVIFSIVFLFAALLNMGTNYWFGEISSITNSIAVILQLALAIDYAIIFCHRYQDEMASLGDPREALIRSLSKAIIEISSSSLTTVSGLLVLTVMQFKLGYDLGIVLAKGIVCSLLTVFLLMPGLLALFPNQLRKTVHKSFVPDIGGWAGFLTKRKFLFVIIFALILPFAIYFSSQTKYVFAQNSADEIVKTEARANEQKISDTFDETNAIALLVPAGDYEKEKRILKEAETFENIKSAQGLANTEIKDGKMLTDLCTPREFSELLDVDVELARVLFRAYGVKNEQYNPIFGNPDEYEVEFLNLFEYLFEKIDQGVVTFDDEQKEDIEELRSDLKRGTDQLRGTNWNRMVFTATVPVEGEESRATVDKIRALAEREYGEGNVLAIGEITSARDLGDTYNGDSVKISLLTILFIFLILLGTFKTVVGSVILVFVIQGSIWINFSIPYLGGTNTPFIINMIVSAIQMGATIDYAIVIMNRYLVLRKEGKEKKDAMASSVRESFATVTTSGLILSCTGFLLGLRIEDVNIGHIGLAVGRGALISMILVLTVLPQMIMLFDKAIEKTTFKIKLPAREVEKCEE